MDKTVIKKRIDLVSSFLKGLKGLFALSVLFYMLSTLLRSALPLIIGFCTDYILGAKEFLMPSFLNSFTPLKELMQTIIADPSQGLMWCAAAVILLAVAGGAATITAKVFLAKGAVRMLKGIRDRLYGHIQRLPFDWHVKNSAGDIIQRCTSDLEVVRGFLCIHLLEVFRILFLVSLSLYIMISINMTLSLIAMVFLPIIALYSIFFYDRIAKKFRIADEAEAELSTVVQENLNGVRVVRAFGREKYEVDKFNGKNKNFADNWIKIGHIQSRYWAIADFITNIQILSIIVAGCYLVVGGSLMLGNFIAFVIYNMSLIWPVRSLGRVLSEMSKAGVSLDRLSYILDEAVECDNDDSKEAPMDKDIVFDIRNFAYGDAKPILFDVKFTIEKGATFAILGGTGSGKSTLMYLLDRLYTLPPECGKITIGGVDIRGIPLKHLRENIGIVLQEPFLFSRSLIDNIKISDPSSTMDDIRGVTQIACVDRSIMEFTDGYETVVGEKGVTLSGGQKQRVAIARMLLQNTPIMIFDDSLSAVDAETDSQIRGALKERMGSATVILISHRISTLMHADKIAVLENGKITQIGNHNELIEQDGIYKRIHDIQVGYSEEESDTTLQEVK